MTLRHPGPVPRTASQAGGNDGCGDPRVEITCASFLQGQQGSLYVPVPSVVWQQQMTKAAGPVALTPHCVTGNSPTGECFSSDVAKDGPSLCRQGSCSKA